MSYSQENNNIGQVRKAAQPLSALKSAGNKNQIFTASPAAAKRALMVPVA